MPGGVLPYQERYLDPALCDYLSSFELRISTLECAMGVNGGPFDSVKMGDVQKQNIVFVRKEDLLRLKDLDINAISLANNHVMDCGVDGLLDLCAELDRLGIRHIGAGQNLAEAKKPLAIEFSGCKIAVIAFQLSDFKKPWCFYPATENSPGLFYVSISELSKYIQELKQSFDKVVLMPHWGEEHQYLQESKFKQAAQKLIKAGADCIIGSHPHIINPVVKFGDKECYFSLGNFLFPEKCMQVPRPMYYPETAEECHSLKRMWTYPKSISEPIVAVWKPKNRIGMMVEMDLSKGMKTRWNLVCLTADNVLHRYASLAIRLRMKFWAMLVHMPKYGFVRRLYNHRYNLVRRFVDKMRPFNIPVEL